MGGSVGGIVATGPLLLAAVLSTVSLESCSQKPAPKPKWAQKPMPVSGSRPTAEVPQTKHDFGVMDPEDTGSHDFEVRNRGTEALTLSGGPASDATIGWEVLQPSVAPGETGTVRVTWHTGRAGPVFRREASIQTNDPFQKTLTFTVSGTVRTVLGVEPPGLSFGELDPRHSSSSATTVVFSQVWDAFTIDEVTCGMAGATWSIESADAAALEGCAAKCGYRLTVTTPTGLPGGPFRNKLEMRAIPARADKATSVSPEPLALPLEGRVLRRLALYGEGLEEGGRLDLGQVRPGQGRRHRLLAKVRDPEPKVRVASLRTKPDFLKVHLQPLRSDDPECGLYGFVVEVPADAPPCIYRGLRPGEIHVRMDHPRLEDVDLKVYFAVCPER
jgi:hypothetical protein